MKQAFIYISFLFFCLASGLQAQTFASRKLAQTGEQFPKICLPTADSIFDCPQVIRGKSLVVRYNSRNEIEHLGVSLFSPETKEMINASVCNFIERMMLELLLQNSTADVQSRLRHYNIRLQQNGVDFGSGFFRSLSDVLDRIDYPTQFTLYKENSLYAAVWKFGNNETLAMIFPAQRELIFGTDKKESDTTVGELLLSDDCDNIVVSAELEPILGENLVRIEGTELYRRKGVVFMIDNINTDIYFQRSDSLYFLVFDPNYPTQSLANLFLTQQITNSLSLKITHRMYGRFTPEFIIPLNRFVCLFSNNFDMYCLLQPMRDGRIQLSVILHSQNFSYFHLLQITTNSKQIFAENGTLTANFFTNIPLHNLRNLFQ